MPLRTVEQYKSSLRDGRVVYFRGKRVEDVTTHPVIGVAVNHAAIDYEIAHQPEHRNLAVYEDPATGQEYSRYFKIATPMLAETNSSRPSICIAPRMASRTFCATCTASSTP